MFFVGMKEVIPSSWRSNFLRRDKGHPCDEEFSLTLFCSATCLLLLHLFATALTFASMLRLRCTIYRWKAHSVLYVTMSGPLSPAPLIYPKFVSFWVAQISVISLHFQPNDELSNLTSVKIKFKETWVFWYEWEIIYAQIALK